MALIMYINWLLPRPFGGISEQFNSFLPSPICLGSDSPMTPFFSSNLSTSSVAFRLAPRLSARRTRTTGAQGKGEGTRCQKLVKSPLGSEGGSEDDANDDDEDDDDDEDMRPGDGDDDDEDKKC